MVNSSVKEQLTALSQRATELAPAGQPIRFRWAEQQLLWQTDILLTVLAVCNDYLAHLPIHTNTAPELVASPATDYADMFSQLFALINTVPAWAGRFSQLLICAAPWVDGPAVANAESQQEKHIIVAQVDGRTSLTTATPTREDLFDMAYEWQLVKNQTERTSATTPSTKR